MNRWNRILPWLGLWLLPLAVLAAEPEAAEPAELLHRDVSEQVIRLPVIVRDRSGRSFSGDIPVTTFHPAGAGPFPLVVINHGRAVTREQRAKPLRQRMESAARFFVRKGFAVAVPTRLGYGETAAVGDPEDGGPCKAEQYLPAAEVSAAQIVATVERLRQEPWVAADRLVILGQSAGGFAVTAAATKALPGLLTAINFAGGRGGDPDKHPGVPCSPEALQQAFESFGHAARVPMLWVYTENDKFFSPSYSAQWAAAYNKAGGQASYRLLPAFGDNGHGLFAGGNDIWQPLVDEYLRQFGFTQPGVLQAPPATTVSSIDDAEAAPLRQGRVRVEDYQRFLSRPTPRAFAMNGKGRYGQSYGDDAQSKALAFCQRTTGEVCWLYAVDQSVVWPSARPGSGQQLP